MKTCIGKVKPEKGVDYFTPEEITQILQMLAPELLAGVEYETAEMWAGKTVYTSLIDCGACSETPTVLTTQIAADKVIRHCGHIGSASLPVTAATDVEEFAWANAFVSEGYIHIAIYNGAGFAGQPAEVRVWYTKTEEE